VPKPRKDPRRRGNRRRYAYALAGLFLVLAYGLWKSQGSGDLASFNALAGAGQTRLESTAVPVLANRSHLPPGQTIRYANLPPTSGPHSPRDVSPGFYRQRPPFTRLVHSLEHGSVVIYYDRPDPKVLALLRRWAGLFSDPFAGVVVVPLKGIGEKVLLTAWGQRLDLAPFDAELAAAFIDRFRGRGPERKVR